MPPKLDLKNKKFGRLLVLEESDRRDKSGAVFWVCRCDCGEIIETRSYSLKSSHTLSCGCFHKECAAAQNEKYLIKHNLSSTRLYGIWCAMKQRCYSEKFKHYNNYGGKGITICDEWLTDFTIFYKWALNTGYKEYLTIDRVNPDKDYSPENCQWITKSENSKRVKIAAYEKGFKEGYRKGFKDGQIRRI